MGFAKQMKLERGARRPLPLKLDYTLTSTPMEEYPYATECVGVLKLYSKVTVRDDMYKDSLEWEQEVRKRIEGHINRALYAEGLQLLHEARFHLDNMDTENLHKTFANMEKLFTGKYE